MNILVCISHVPDTTSKINFSDDNKTFLTAGLQFIINPYDEIALTRALEITEKNGGSVTVINVGDASTEPTIRKALAIGATDAVRINAIPADAFFVATQIANYARTKNFDIILCGRESIDYNGAQVHAMIAEILQMPSVSIAKALDITNNIATIEREIEGGKEIIECPLPIVVGASEGMAEPRIPNMRGIMSARTKPLTIAEATPCSSLVTYHTYHKPKARSAVNLVQPDEVEKLVQLLHTEAKVI